MTTRATTMQAAVESLIRAGLDCDWELTTGERFHGTPVAIFRDDEGYWVRFKEVTEGDLTRYAGQIRVDSICMVERRGAPEFYGENPFVTRQKEGNSAER